MDQFFQLNDVDPNIYKDNNIILYIHNIYLKNKVRLLLLLLLVLLWLID